MVVIEAMSQRLPVVATPQGSARMLVRDGETGLRVPLRSVEGLTAAMLRLLDDPALGRRLAEQAYPLAQSHTWTQTAERTLVVYERAIAQRRGRA